MLKRYNSPGSPGFDEKLRTFLPEQPESPGASVTFSGRFVSHIFLFWFYFSIIVVVDNHYSIRSRTPRARNRYFVALNARGDSWTSETLEVTEIYDRFLTRENARIRHTPMYALSDQRIAATAQRRVQYMCTKSLFITTFTFRHHNPIFTPYAACVCKTICHV